MFQPHASPNFVRLPGAGGLAAGAALAARAGRYEVAIFNVGGELFALENSCPHQGGPIADGWLEAGVVTCPWHGWCFNVRTGKMTLGDYARIARFSVFRDGPDLWVSAQPLEDEG